MPLQPGQVIHNRYRIVKLLGQGGMGAVYRAWDTALAKACALKENFEVTPEAQKQFEREAHLLSNLTHPNLPRVTDYFIMPGQGQYLVMDFIEGQDLHTKLDAVASPKVGLPENQVIPWIIQVCGALSYLHGQNPPIIHRDIKPANIKINDKGQAVLVDFGIAKIYDPTSKTTQGARAITPGYSPPEQYGQGITDGRSDLYALGATLYTCLTGQTPPESIQRTLGTPLSSPRSIDPAISANIEAAILHALALRPEDRPQTANEFKHSLTARAQPVNAIHTHATQTTQALQATAQSQVVPAKKHQPIMVIMLGLLFLITLAGGFGILRGVRQTRLQTHQENTQTAVAAELLANLKTISANLTETAQADIIYTQQASLSTAQAQLEVNQREATRTADVAWQLRSIAQTQTVVSQLFTAQSQTSEAVLSAVQENTRQAELVATQIAATLTAQEQIPSLSDFMSCPKSCDTSDNQTSFPEKTTQIFFQWDYANIPPGTHFVRTWSVDGREWVRYDCSWPYPENGFFSGRLFDSEGLTSGTWVIQVYINEQLLLEQSLVIRGNWNLWTPAGVFYSCTGKR